MGEDESEGGGRLARSVCARLAPVAARHARHRPDISLFELDALCSKIMSAHVSWI